MRKLKIVKDGVKPEFEIKPKKLQIIFVFTLFYFIILFLCVKYDERLSYSDDGFQLVNKCLLITHYVLGTLLSTE